MLVVAGRAGAFAQKVLIGGIPVKIEPVPDSIFTELRLTASGVGDIKGLAISAMGRAAHGGLCWHGSRRQRAGEGAARQHVLRALARARQRGVPAHLGRPRADAQGVDDGGRAAVLDFALVFALIFPHPPVSHSAQLLACAPRLVIHRCLLACALVSVTAAFGHVHRQPHCV